MVNNTVYHLLVLTWQLTCFWKKGNIRKGCVENEDWGTSEYFVWGFKKVLCKACLLFNCLLVIKRIVKALFSFIPWSLNFSDLLWLKFKEKIYTKAIAIVSSEEHPFPYWGKVPPSQLFDSLRWGSFSLA